MQCFVRKCSFLSNRDSGVVANAANVKMDICSQLCNEWWRQSRARVHHLSTAAANVPPSYYSADICRVLAPEKVWNHSSETKMLC